MFNKSLAFLEFMLLIFFFGIAAAEESTKSIETLMNEIRQEQGLTNGQNVDIGKVSPGKLEELGSAVMNVMIPNKTQHEWMDRMMGGEGSQSLAAFHQRFGYNYLAGFPLGMMGGGMAGYPWFYPLNNAGIGRGGYMMGGYGYGPGMMGWFGWGGMFMGLIFLVLIVLAIVIIVRAAGRNTFGFSGQETPLDILKKRYAKGEISKEQFETMKKDL